MTEISPISTNLTPKDTAVEKEQILQQLELSSTGFDLRASNNLSSSNDRIGRQVELQSIDYFSTVSILTGITEFE